MERSPSGISRGVPFKPPLTPTLLSASVVADVPVGVNAVLVILWQGDVSGYGGADTIGAVVQLKNGIAVATSTLAPPQAPWRGNAAAAIFVRQAKDGGAFRIRYWQLGIGEPAQLPIPGKLLAGLVIAAGAVGVLAWGWRR